MTIVAVLGPGRIGRQIALAFAVGGCPVRLVDVKEGRPAAEAERTLADARREIARDLGLMVEEQVIVEAESAAVLDEDHGHRSARRRRSSARTLSVSNASRRSPA